MVMTTNNGKRKMQQQKWKPDNMSARQTKSRPAPVFVKICGLRDVASAQVAVDSAADALGFILAKSRRQIMPHAIRDIRHRLTTRVGEMPPLVGVVVNPTPDEIAPIVAESEIDMIQLSGDQTPDILANIDVPVIKALRFPSGMPPDNALREVSSWLDGPNPAQHIIVEGHADGSYGGTGTRAEWTLVAEVAKRYPVILAGGLDPDNVAGAVSDVRPFGVDVSSGIETDGVKNHDKIRRFVGSARHA